MSSSYKAPERVAPERVAPKRVAPKRVYAVSCCSMCGDCTDFWQYPAIMDALPAGPCRACGAPCKSFVPDFEPKPKLTPKPTHANVLKTGMVVSL